MIDGMKPSRNRVQSPEAETESGPSHFDAFAQNYHEVLSGQLNASGLTADYFAEQKSRIIVDKCLRSESGRSCAAAILDVGCGNGLMDSLVAARCAGLGEAEVGQPPDIFGIDVSSASVEQAQALNIPKATFSVFDGRSIPFEDNSFDVVLFCVVMHHVPPGHRVELLKECWRVAKPGAKLCIFEHNPYNPLTRFIVSRCPFDSDAVLLSCSECCALLGEAGFRIAESRYINFFPNRMPFRCLIPYEARLGGIPMGAQYFVMASKG
jgi:SAM-dependent methyltransferase